MKSSRVRGPHPPLAQLGFRHPLFVKSTGFIMCRALGRAVLGLSSDHGGPRLPPEADTEPESQMPRG